MRAPKRRKFLVRVSAFTFFDQRLAGCLTKTKVDFLVEANYNLMLGGFVANSSNAKCRATRIIENV